MDDPEGRLVQSGAAKMTNVGGRPAGPIKCERCRKKSKPCGQLCANWPGPASPSVVQQAEVTAADVIAAVATASVPTRRVSARGKVPRRERDVDFPELRDRATGKRHHGGGGAEEEGEEEEEEGEGETAKAAGLLLRLSGSRRRAPPPLPPQEGLPTAGTLRDGSVVVKESSLGEHAGLGLFAGRRFPKGQLITAYAGPLFYPEQLGDRDASCADCL